MTDEQKHKRRDYRKEYVKNMTDEQKQKLKDYRREYYKKYCATKKLNNKTVDDEIIDDDSDKIMVMTVIMKMILNILFFSKCI